MVQSEILSDGWRQFHTSKGVLFRWNVDHVQRCVNAIRRRHESEVEISYERKSKVIQLKRKV